MSPPDLRVVGDAPALTLADVYRDHLDFVVRIVRRLGVRPNAAEDVVHDVFLIVHRRLPDFDGRSSMRSWLYGVARRVVLHHHRNDARRQRRHQNAPVPHEGIDLEERAARSEAVAWIERFLDELDEPQRIVFSLADIEGMPVPEIAETLDVKLNTVYSRLRLARRRFERALRRRAKGGER